MSLVYARTSRVTSESLSELVLLTRRVQLGAVSLDRPLHATCNVTQEGNYLPSTGACEVKTRPTAVVRLEFLVDDVTHVARRTRTLDASRCAVRGARQLHDLLVVAAQVLAVEVRHVLLRLGAHARRAAAAR